jgi:hypothetical protein
LFVLASCCDTSTLVHIPCSDEQNRAHTSLVCSCSGSVKEQRFRERNEYLERVKRCRIS